MTLMLLRNLNPKRELCNGTRMTFDRVLQNKILECTVSSAAGRRKVFIPRITLRPKPGQYPVDWSRRQFPVAPAASFTINKSQVSAQIVGICRKFNSLFYLRVRR
jgi:hypothetical protein